MRRLATLILLVLAHATLSSQSALVIVLDDVAAVDLALYGGPVATPNLAVLAAEGVVFTAAIANPTCSPSRRSMMTGRWSVRDAGGICSAPDADTPPLTELFLPEIIAPSYRTTIIGKWHLGGNVTGGPWQCAPLTQGFDSWEAGSAANLTACGGTGYELWSRVTADSAGCSDVPTFLYEPYAVRDSFLAFWRQRGKCLAIVSSSLAHGPRHVPPADLLPPGYRPPPTPRGKFEAMVLAYDTLIGEILAAVDLQTTLVIVVGDNGTAMPVAPDPDRAKGTTFERGIRVPLIMAGGPLGRGGYSTELVHIVDVWATIGEWCNGLVMPPTSPSRSLLQPDASPHKYVLCGYRWGETSGDRCARSLRFKLRQLDDDGDELVDREELYDLTLDPDETINLVYSPAHAAQAAAMRAWIEQEAP